MMLVDGALRDVPAGAVAYDRSTRAWIFDPAVADRMARRAAATVVWIPAEVVELWEDATGKLSIHIEGAPVTYLVAAESAAFERDVAALLASEDPRASDRWRESPWNEHADLVAEGDGPRLVAVWDLGQVQVMHAGSHPFGRDPAAAAKRYLGLPPG